MFPQLFRFCSDLGNSWIRQIVRKSMLTGRWWEGRILINLCGKNNVRNCDLLQSDFFASCRTVLGVGKGCFWRVWWNLEKDEAPKRCDFLRLRNMLLKATFPSSYLGLVEATLAALKKCLLSYISGPKGVSVHSTKGVSVHSDISGPKGVSVHSTAEMKLYRVSSTAQILKYAYIFVHVVEWTAPPNSPIKTLWQRQTETGWHA